MQKLNGRIFSASGLALLLVTSAAVSQVLAQGAPVRVRGEITKVEGNTLSVKSRSGENLDREARRAAADFGHGQVFAGRHQGRLVYRRVRDAAA